MKKLCILLILIVLAAVMAPSAAAVEFDSASNKFIFSDSSTTSQDVDGDFLAFASSVRLNGAVGGDVIAAGGDVTISNASNQNIFAAGQDVLITVGTARNIYAGGTHIDVAVSGEITGAYLAGRNISFNGTATVFNAAGGSVILDGVIRDNAVIRSDDITFGNDVSIGGTLTIYASKMPPLPAVIDESRVVFHKVSAAESSYLSNNYRWIPGSWTLIGLLSAILMAVLITLFKGGFIRENALAFRGRAGRAVLWGFVAFIVVPAASMFAMITLVGFSSAVIVLIVYVIFLSLAPVIAGAVLGRLILANMNRYLSAIIGAAVLRIAVALPVVGVIVWFASAFYVLGIIVMSIRPYREEKGGALQAPQQ